MPGFGLLLTRRSAACLIPPSGALGGISGNDRFFVNRSSLLALKLEPAVVLPFLHKMLALDADTSVLALRFTTAGIAIAEARDVKGEGKQKSNEPWPPDCAKIAK